MAIEVKWLEKRVYGKDRVDSDNYTIGEIGLEPLYTGPVIDWWLLGKEQLEVLVVERVDDFLILDGTNPESGIVFQKRLSELYGADSNHPHLKVVSVEPHLHLLDLDRYFIITSSGTVFTYARRGRSIGVSKIWNNSFNVPSITDIDAQSLKVQKDGTITVDTNGGGSFAIQPDFSSFTWTEK